MKHHTGQESRQNTSRNQPHAPRRGRHAAGQRPAAGGAKRRALTLACALLILVMMGLGVYIANWYIDRARIRDDSERYRAMYNPAGRGEAAESPFNDKDAPSPSPSATAMPTATVPPAPTATTPPTPTATASPTPTATVTPTPTATITPTPMASASPTPTAAPSPTPVESATPSPKPSATATATVSPTPTATASVSPSPTATASPTPTAAASPTPTPTPSEEAGPLVLALPTAPPVQDSFGDLVRYNPETVAYLEIDEELSLPVVQRVNDNDFYLSHDFGGAKAREGTLFLDGINRLVPEDDCLIVYGHNMKNGTMFGSLDRFERVKYVRAHPVIHFDTIYEDRLYAPFAAFTASMNPSDRHYFEVRRFGLDEAGLDAFIQEMQARSAWAAPIDVQCGDRLLLLVTCDYTNHQGRFILALRQLRPDEDEAGIRALFEGM